MAGCLDIDVPRKVGAGLGSCKVHALSRNLNTGPMSHVFDLREEPPRFHVDPIRMVGWIDQGFRQSKWNGSGNPSSIARSVAAPADVPGSHEGERGGRWRLPAAATPPEPLAISENDHRATLTLIRLSCVSVAPTQPTRQPSRPVVTCSHTQTGRVGLVIRAGGPFYEQIASALREAITSGQYRPGDQLPSERELREQWKVSQQTVRAAFDQLRAEGLVVSFQGRGVYVREQAVPRRLSTDITTSLGWYTTLARQGLKPAGKTTVHQAPASDEVAEWLGLEKDTDVIIRDRDLGVEGEPPIMAATSHFPLWVVEAAPALGDPNRGGMPEHLREAFGDTYSNDVLTVRMPTRAEQQRLDLPPGTPVQIIRGGTYDQQHRPLHYIYVMGAAGRIEFAYRYGTVPTDPQGP